MATITLPTDAPSVLAAAPVADNPPIADNPPSILRQFHLKYAVQDTRSLAWQPFQTVIESDLMLDAIRGLHEAHYWRPLYVVTVEFQPVEL